MREILKLPEGNKQIHGGSCGPHALKKVIQYRLGIDVPEHKLINLSCCSWRSGTSIEGLIRVARNFNLDHIIKHNSSVEDIISSIKTENPAILFIQEWGSGHYVVANGYDDKYEKVFYYDPLYGKTRNMNFETLDKIWYGIDVFKRNRFGIFFK